jgi:hypothetical protein
MVVMFSARKRPMGRCQTMENFTFAKHRSATKSLFSVPSGATQVGGASGLAAAEILLQSHEHELAFVPALPDSWKDGEVK